MQTITEPQKLTIKKFQSLEKDEQTRLFNRVIDWDRTSGNQYSTAALRQRQVANALNLSQTLVQYLFERNRVPAKQVSHPTVITKAKFNSLGETTRDGLILLTRNRYRELFKDKFKSAAVTKISQEFNLSLELAEDLFTSAFYTRGK